MFHMYIIVMLYVYYYEMIFRISLVTIYLPLYKIIIVLLGIFPMLDIISP